MCITYRYASIKVLIHFNSVYLCSVLKMKVSCPVYCGCVYQLYKYSKRWCRNTAIHNMMLGDRVLHGIFFNAIIGSVLWARAHVRALVLDGFVATLGICS